VNTMQEFEKILKALANQRRLAILEYIKRVREAHVGEIAFAINAPFRSTSRHLRILYAARLVVFEQRNNEIYYRLAGGTKIFVQQLVLEL